jgi:hypothetical protein
MIRMAGTDSPAPDNALVLPASAHCDRDTPSHGIVLQSGASNLDGRKGNFLVFRYVDQVSAGNFTVFDVHTGRTLFSDGVLHDITAVTLSPGILHMRYNRGINAPCSLLSDRDVCWTKLLASGQIPRGAFSGPPLLETCRKSYGSDSDDQRPPNLDEDPSIVSYDVALTLDSKGNATVKPVGPMQCDPES